MYLQFTFYSQDFDSFIILSKNKQTIQLKFEKFNSLIGLFLVITILSFSVTFPMDEAFSLRDLDYDLDGVLDEDDECPHMPETYNQFQDMDGCPDSVSEEITSYQFPDSDGDGLEDRKDSCVYLPEIWNNYLDDDGCPEIVPTLSNMVKDFDSDGIPDLTDACPNKKETINEFKDADGCPDSLGSSLSRNSFNSSMDYDQCLGDKLPTLRINSQEIVCVNLETAKRWEQLGIAEIVMPLVIEDTIQPGDLQEKIISKTKPEIELPNYSDQTKIPQKLLTSDDVSSLTILDTDKTVIGQDISYPSGSPQIVSKIVTIPVGAETGTHIHEYPMFAYVLEGEIIVDYGDQGIKTFAKGDSLIEAINFDHNGKNMGNEPAEILVVLMGEN